MPLRFIDRILQDLSHAGDRPVLVDAVARRLGVTSDDRWAFDEAVGRLANQQLIEVDDQGRARLPKHEEEIIGRIFVTQKGHAYVKPERLAREGDLFVPQGDTADAMTGDRVRVAVVRRSRGWRETGRGAAPDAPTGRVLEVITRGRTRFAGTLIQDGRRWLVQPDGKALREPIIVRDPHAKEAKAGDKVTVDLTRFPSEEGPAEGAIVEVLGEAGQPAVETAAVMASYGLIERFPDEVHDQASRAAIAFEREAQGPWSDRLDLTDELIWTIDPPDARDYDDACSVRFDEAEGIWELGVHIADVSHFVTLDSPLDVEGRRRGNSAYLPRRVVPMLPETLSNGVCSLQEGVPRFCKSAFIRFDRSGRVLDERFAQTVIRSRKRLTYLEAQCLIDGKPAEARRHARNDTEPTDELVANLRMANTLARLLQKRRRAQGQLVLDLPQSELVFDADGRVIDAVPEDDAFTHTLIEMFMVEANEAVARLFSSLEIPLIRRIHPPPAFKDIEELRAFARTVGFRLPEEPERADLLQLLEHTRGTDSARAVHFAVLKTLAKATYAPALIGHYALASEHYAHFTSPIRRYPDLTVHRSLEAYLELSDNGRNPPGGRKRRDAKATLESDPRCPHEGALADIGRHCSETEVNAEAAERELRTFLVLQFLQDNHMGDELEGVVTGMAPAGVWVSISKYLADGLVRFNALPSARDRPDRWTVNERTGRLVSVRSGASVGLGDRVKVGILSIDLASRTMDLSITKLGRAPAMPGEDASRKQEGPGRDGRDPRRDLLSREHTAWTQGHKRGFKRGRRGRKSR
ncbi:MAG: ribonuclease R family protein [Phycisphaerales bacterium]|jgi:ribonuclease R